MLKGLYAMSMNLMDVAQAQFNAALEVIKIFMHMIEWAGWNAVSF